MTGKTRGRRPTMRDVAEEAGVSPALVSIVFRDAPGASEQTRERVREAAKKIGYVLDERARLLRSHKSLDIGISFHTSQPFHHHLLDEIYSAINGLDYGLVLSPKSTVRDEKTALSSLVSYRCGAIILFGTRLSKEEINEIVGDIPVISVAQELDAPYDWVSSDDSFGIYQVIDHLVDLGHENIALANSPGDAGATTREHAFVSALKDRDMTPIVYSADGAEEGGARLAKELIDSDNLPTAILGFNDRCAFGIIDYCIRAGLSIPRDLSVVGFDNSEVSQRFYVNLTTVAQDTKRLARFAAERAIQRLKSINLESQGRGILVPTELIVRETTAVPRSENRP